MDIAAVATELCKQEFIAADWKEKHLRIWLKGCKCAYCQTNLLENRGLAYYFYSYDHLLPKNQYPRFEESPDNLVLSCRQCNAIKGEYDPNKVTPLFNPAADQAPTPQQWKGRKARATVYISKTRTEREIQFERPKRAILEQLETILVNDKQRTTNDCL